MYNFGDKSNRQIYDLLVKQIGKQLVGINKSEELKELKKEADKRDSNLYEIAFEIAINEYQSPIPIKIDKDEKSDQIKKLKMLLEGSGLELAEVIGNSMSDANIKTGDYVLYEKSGTPRNGQIVIAEYLNQTFVKIYFKSKEKIILKSANEDYENIEIAEIDNFTINGVVKMIIKEI